MKTISVSVCETRFALPVYTDDGEIVSNKNYNLVMSDHHGIISNNDIEMVVLAFSNDEVQLFQEDPRHKGTISKALGRGN